MAHTCFCRGNSEELLMWMGSVTTAHLYRWMNNPTAEYRAELRLRQSQKEKKKWIQMIIAGHMVNIQMSVVALHAVIRVNVVGLMLMIRVLGKNA